MSDMCPKDVSELRAEAWHAAVGQLRTEASR